MEREEFHKRRQIFCVRRHDKTTFELEFPKPIVGGEENKWFGLETSSSGGCFLCLLMKLFYHMKSLIYETFHIKRSFVVINETVSQPLPVK